MAPQKLDSPVLKEEHTDTAHIDSPEEEPQRGRKKARDEDDDDAEDDKDGIPRNGERKRKRSRKALDKKFECPHDGCGKSYSRAEHLYRHQLNHTPKQIYSCNFPDCSRQFVRQDLCVRHRERHNTKGSNLQRKDNYITQALVGQAPKHLPQTKNAEGNNEIGIGTYNPPYDTSSAILPSPTDSMGPPRNDLNHNDRYQASSFQPANTPYKTSLLHRSNSDSQYNGESNSSAQMARNSQVSYMPQHRPGSLGSIDAPGFRTSATVPHTETSTSENVQWSGGQPRMNLGMQNHNSVYNGFGGQYPAVSDMPVQYPTTQNGLYSSQYYNGTQAYTGRNVSGDSGTAVHQTESPINDLRYSVFEEEIYGRSPSMIPEGFTKWLLDPTQQSGQNDQGGMGDFILDPSLQVSFNGLATMPPQTSMMNLNSLLEPPSRNAIISEAKRQQLIDLIETTFVDGGNSPVANERAQLLQGDWNSEKHVLSKQNIQYYIASYWLHFHDQMPILHHPTFSADKCQNLLLVAVLAIGAANLDKGHSPIMSAAADLAQFLAWHLRNKLFEDRDFSPPTKLWVLQSLILLECYEKLYSTRFLHERSTIHHATTISLVRRGSALLGRSAMDSPSGEEDKQSFADTTDPWWNHWIMNEATKRVAYALFIIDSTHAIMFGHTVAMAAHEMRLPLPCDEALWMAKSGMEVGKLEQSLRNEGFTLMSFPDGLKCTLNRTRVRTNRFGRTALMAGLLNVTVHLNQRDLQVRQLGVIGGKEPVWRLSLTNAFDYWERDWDNDHDPTTSSVPTNRHVRDSSHSSSYSSSTVDEERTFESRVVLHHLAHMGMHVDIVQCQVYARAKRLLGRTLTKKDYATCAKRMKDWALKATARDAVFYSLKFLGAVLAPDMMKESGTQQKPPPFRAAAGEYVPRDDYLLNRPWVVYYAALVVWSYGYALEGPLKPSTIPSLETKEEQRADMRAFLGQVSALDDPKQLMDLTGSRNQCTGLLCFLGAQFKKSRWELMREASVLLGNCVDMLRGAEGNGHGIV